MYECIPVIVYLCFVTHVEEREQVETCMRTGKRVSACVSTCTCWPVDLVVNLRSSCLSPPQTRDDWWGWDRGGAEGGRGREVGGKGTQHVALRSAGITCLTCAPRREDRQIIGRSHAFTLAIMNPSPPLCLSPSPPRPLPPVVIAKPVNGLYTGRGDAG